MKIIVIVPAAQITEAQLKEIGTMISEKFKMSIAINAIDIDVTALMATPNGKFGKSSKPSAFNIAVHNILEICGDPTSQPEAFRGALWDAILVKRIIEIPALELLAQGPLTNVDRDLLKKNCCEFIPFIAVSALTRLM